MNKEDRKLLNEITKRKIGITYDEFELLDFDEQQRLIEEKKQ